MKLKHIIFAFLAIVLLALSYIFSDRGMNTRTKNTVKYKENSDVLYKVHLLSNDEFDEDYLNMGERYISSLVNDIDLKFSYKSEFEEEISGYYVYDVVLNLKAYQKDTHDILWNKSYNLIKDKTVMLDDKGKSIVIDADTVVDYDKYKDEFLAFQDKYWLTVDGYLEINFKLKEALSVRLVKDVIEDEKVIKVTVPLSEDTFRVAILNDNNGVKSYSNFSTKERVNYLLIALGIVVLSFGITFLILFIREMILMFGKGNSYQYELSNILREYDDIIISVKRFYNKKKYNIIYVNSFKDILDVYDRTGSPISYKEVRKDYESMFLIIDDDNAWVYKMERNANK